jgi:glycosyltransferase involved in cell wall biosynthesis
MKYLKVKNFHVEFLLLNASPAVEVPWYILPPPIRNLADISVRNNFRLSRILISKSFSRWLEHARAKVNRFLPESILPARFSRWFMAKRKNLSEFDGDDSVKGKICPDLWDDLPMPGEIDFVKKIIYSSKPDVIILDRMWLADIFDLLPEDNTCLKVILTHDIVHQRITDMNKIGISCQFIDWSEKSEAEKLEKADILLAIQEEDCNRLRKIAPLSEIVYMPISATPYESVVTPVPGRCIFVGSHSDHNIDGLKWFLDEVWPLILKIKPTASLHIYGTINSAINESYENVIFKGRVQDLCNGYNEAEVCIIPLRVGSGLKIKLIEALSYGRACVSTSMGIQGLNNLADKAVIVADSENDFADAVCTILSDNEKRRNMESQALNYVEENFNPAAAYQPFVDIIRDKVTSIKSK